MRYGVPGFCEFSFLGPRSITQVDPIFLPANAPTAMLSFWSFEMTEFSSPNCEYDTRHVYVSEDQGNPWVLLGECFDRDRWYERHFSLTPWLGKSIQLRFEFDAMDGIGNSGIGWVLDDIRIELDACVPAYRYCSASSNSFSADGAVINYRGTNSYSANDFTLTLSNAPPNRFARFLYGGAPAAVPTGDGVLCVSDPSSLLGQSPPSHIGPQGSLQYHLDLSSTAGTPTAILPGTTWYFQAWFRDPAGGIGNSNFSDAIEVIFCP